SSRRRHTSSDRDWSSDVCSSDLTRVCRDTRREQGAGSWEQEPALHGRVPLPAPRSLLPIIMPKGGLEPPRACAHWLLKPARLPVPPLRRRKGTANVSRGITSSQLLA